jgi:hypothetical protein
MWKLGPKAVAYKLRVNGQGLLRAPRYDNPRAPAAAVANRAWAKQRSRKPRGQISASQGPRVVKLRLHFIFDLTILDADDGSPHADWIFERMLLLRQVLRVSP